MRVVIAGGHGKIALLLTRQLADAGHHPLGLIRNPDHEADVVAAGGEGIVLDLENSSDDDVAAALRGADAVVFAAGAGPNSGAERKLTVDRDGAIALARAAKVARVPRYVMVSAIGTDDYDADSDEVYQIYLHAKSDADAYLRATDLEWTIVRPGHLTDDPGTGRVRLADSVERGDIPRADVAAIIVAALDTPASIGKQFEAVSGDDPIPDALAAR